MNRAGGVAVILVNWNSGSDLQKSLSALGDQVLQPRKILVVDNASTDRSLQGIEEQFPGVEVIRLRENTGFAAANNLAVRRAAGCEWIAFLNPDAFPRPDWLARLVAAAETHPGCAFIGSRLLRHGAPDELDGTGDVYHVSGLAWRRDHGCPASQTTRPTGEIFSPCAAAALIRKDVFLEAGGFDEHFHSYFEDVDLGFRLRLLGHRCLYAADAVVEHVGSATTHRYSDYAVYHGHRNLVWTYFKNMPSQLLWIYLPQHIVATAAALLWFCARGQGRIIFKAKWDAWKDLPRVLVQRGEIRKTRKIPIQELWRVMARGLLLPYTKRKRRISGGVKKNLTG